MESENENINMKYGITFHLKQLQYKSLLNHSKITSSNYSMHLFVYCMNLVNYHFDQVRRKFPFLSKVRYVKQPQATKLTSSLHFSLVIGITYNFTVFFLYFPSLNYQSLLLKCTSGGIIRRLTSEFRYVPQAINIFVLPVTVFLSHWKLSNFFPCNATTFKLLDLKFAFCLFSPVLPFDNSY